MSDFNPKAYLAKVKGGGFDPKAYLAKAKAPLEVSDDELTPEERQANAPPSGLTPQQEALEQLGGPVTAGVYGAANFSSLGMADEMGGALGVPVDLGKRALRGVGLMDPEPRVSDESHQPGVVINGQVREPAHIISDSEPESKSLVDVYREGRDSLRAMDDTTADMHPIAYYGTGLASLAAIPEDAARVPMAATRLGRIGQGAKAAIKIGGAFAAGNSKADLTKGEVADFAGDIEDGAALAAPFGAAGNLYAGRQADRQAKAAADALSHQEALAQKTLASARGALGGETSAGFRTLEHLESIVADEAADPALRQEAIAFLASDGGKALKDSVLRNAVLRGRDQLGRIEGAQGKFAEAAEGARPDVVADKTSAYLDKSTLKEDVYPRLKRYLLRKFTGVVSNAAGGGDVGQVASTIVGAHMGDPGTALANLLAKDRFRYKAAGVMGKAAEGLSSVAAKGAGGFGSEKLSEYANGSINPALFSSKYGPQLEEAKAKGDKALAISHFLMMSKDPEYRAIAEQRDDD